MTEEQLGPYLHEDEYLIPHDLGLPELSLDDPDINTDHPWYEISEIEPTKDKPTINMTAQELLSRLKNVEWDEVGAMHRLGLL